MVVKRFNGLKWAVLLLAVFVLAACRQSQMLPQEAGHEGSAQQAVTPAVKTEAFVADSVLLFEPEHIDLGSVKEGEDAVGYLRVRNAGDHMASIVAMETSCGCSVAEPEQRLLMPGEFTRVRVVVDTFAKQGEAKKWVQLSDDAGHRSRGWITLKVLPNPHLDGTSRSIFQGKCAACHFDPAKGKVSGPEIYQAVCAMCHGKDQQGVSGPSLRHHSDVAVLAAVISHGVGSQHMPGFAQAEGGPLSAAQVSVLSQWLSTLDE